VLSRASCWWLPWSCCFDGGTSERFPWTKPKTGGSWPRQCWRFSLRSVEVVGQSSPLKGETVVERIDRGMYLVEQLGVAALLILVLTF